MHHLSHPLVWRQFFQNCVIHTPSPSRFEGSFLYVEHEAGLYRHPPLLRHYRPRAIIPSKIAPMSPPVHPQNFDPKKNAPLRRGARLQRRAPLAPCKDRAACGAFHPSTVVGQFLSASHQQLPDNPIDIAASASKAPILPRAGSSSDRACHIDSSPRRETVSPP